MPALTRGLQSGWLTSACIQLCGLLARRFARFEHGMLSVDMHGGLVTVNGKSEKTALARTHRSFAMIEVHAGLSEEGPRVPTALQEAEKAV